jgi:hypothetical protein
LKEKEKKKVKEMNLKLIGLVLVFTVLVTNGKVFGKIKTFD